jgi:hypothetical protein
LRSYGLRMVQDFVLRLALIQTIDQSFWYCHNRPRGKLSLSCCISTLETKLWL